MNEAFRQGLFQAITRAASAAYGDALVALAVFGSYGRGTATSASDVDLLVVLQAKPAGRLACLRAFEPVESAVAASLGHASPELSPVFRTPEALQRGFPLMLDMVEDAVILYDPQGVLGRALERLRRRMAALGSRRVCYRGAWYWDLKPDFRPGETLRL